MNAISNTGCLVNGAAEPILHPELGIFFQPPFRRGEMVVKFNLVDKYDMLETSL